MDWKEGLYQVIERIHDMEEPHLIHASPPCQGYSKKVTSRSSKWVPTKGKDEPRLIADVRAEIDKLGCDYVIENVMGAREDLVNPIQLCGVMFGLPIPRHRLFETTFNLAAPEHPKCRGVAKRYSEANNIDYRDMRVSGKGRNKGTSGRWRSFMGIDWYCSQSEIVEMIPPSYTEYIGNQYALCES